MISDWILWLIINWSSVRLSGFEALRARKFLQLPTERRQGTENFNHPGMGCSFVWGSPKHSLPFSNTLFLSFNKNFKTQGQIKSKNASNVRRPQPLLNRFSNFHIVAQNKPPKGYDSQKIIPLAKRTANIEHSLSCYYVLSMST